jgi:hypothetical protein
MAIRDEYHSILVRMAIAFVAGAILALGCIATISGR